MSRHILDAIPLAVRRTILAAMRAKGLKGKVRLDAIDLPDALKAHIQTAWETGRWPASLWRVAGWETRG
jgi:hypothetical protein